MGNNFKYLYILYNDIRYNFQTHYNNLNLSQILLFNIPLKFKLYLANKEFKIKKQISLRKIEINKSLKEVINLLGKKKE